MKGRYRFIDVYRGLAILLMLHGHTTDALLDPASKSNFLFQFYTAIRGFTAPMFLFISGFAFSVATLKHADEYFKFSGKFFRRIRKFIFIILLGYFLHLPYLSLRKLLNMSSFDELAQFYASDVLQVIGLTLLFMQVLLFVLKDERKFASLMLFIGALVIFSAPIFYSFDLLKVLPLPFAQYLNNFYGSNFPLLPWAGYVMFGSWVGYTFRKMREIGLSEIFMKKVVKISTLIFPTAFVLEFVFEIIFKPSQQIIYSSPLLSVSRIAFVLMLLYVVWAIDSRVKVKIHPLQYLGMESLFAYVFHLMIVYGSPVNPFHSYKAFWGGSLGYPQVFVLFLILLGMVSTFCYFLNKVKTRNDKALSYLRFAIANIILLIFFINPY